MNLSNEREVNPLSRKPEKFLILDTETCNSVEEPLPYDIGYAICDRRGTICVERSFVVAETFLDMADVMKSAYYAEKIPRYWEDIKSGKRVLKSFYNIRKQIHEDIKKYNVKKIGAYNMSFDRKALDLLTRWVTKSRFRWFFPFGMKYFCIWHMACQTLLNTKTYIDFAEKNGLISPADNVLTSAEACYKFLTKNVDFTESHTGLEDVQIEVEIMARCYKTHKKMSTEINRGCWRLPQRKRKELELRKVFA